jgi:Tfp pilus assembly protein PilF
MENSVMDNATKLWKRAYQRQLAGDLDAAIDLYQRSIDLHPTAEAHTFLGWAYSQQERYEDGIAECLRAISIDDSFGNPYNDIGAYLMELNRWDEAEIWLERAIDAPRYDHRALPHMNLARLSLHRGDEMAALRAFKQAWLSEPSYIPALNAFQAMVARLN